MVWFINATMNQTFSSYKWPPISLTEFKITTFMKNCKQIFTGQFIYRLVLKSFPAHVFSAMYIQSDFQLELIV